MPPPPKAAPGTAPAIKQTAPPPPKGPEPSKEGARTPDAKKDFPKRAPGGQTSPAAPDKGGPPAKGAPGAAPGTPPPGAPSYAAPPAPKGPPPAIPPSAAPGGTSAPGPTAAPRRFDEVQKDRLERVEEGGRRVIQEPGNRIIVKQDNRAVIRHDEAERFKRRPVRAPSAGRRRRRDRSTSAPTGCASSPSSTPTAASSGAIAAGRTAASTTSSTTAASGATSRSASAWVRRSARIVALPPPRITIPRDRYIVDYERASDDDLYETLDAPPIEDLERSYSLEEVRDNYELRPRVRRIDLDTINFEFGAWEVSPDQDFKLERLRAPCCASCAAIPTRCS